MKGTIFFMPMLWLVLTVSLSIALISFTSVVPSQHLGTSQEEIMELYQEFQLKNVEQSTLGRIELVDFIYNLSLWGGSLESKCGYYYGLPLWSGKNLEDEYSECFPILTDQIQKKFNNENYDSYASLEPNLYLRMIAKNFTRIGDKRFYEDKLSYTVDIPYNDKDYKKIGEVIKKVSEDCQKEEKNIERCVERSIPKEFEIIRPEDFPGYETKFEADHLIQFFQKSTTNSCSKDYDFGGLSYFNQEELLKGEINSYDLTLSQSSGIPPNQDLSQKSLILQKGTLFKENKNLMIVNNDEWFKNRPCLLDERIFILHYQSEGFLFSKKIDYYVPFYVKDTLPPEYKRLEAEDMPFDEDHVLISWTSNEDSKQYNLTYGGKTIVIKPWELNIQKEMGDCNIKRKEDNLAECSYSFGTLSSDIYYFYDDEIFTYKLPYSGEVTLTAIDNDGNEFSRTVTSNVEDDLPVQSLNYVITPIVDSELGTYSSVSVTLLSQPSLNMDGSDLKSTSSLLFFENPAGEIERSDGTYFTEIAYLGGTYSITDSPKFLVLMDDPSLKEDFPTNIFQCFQMMGFSGSLIPC